MKVNICFIYPTNLLVFLSFLLATCTSTNNFHKKKFKNKNYHLKITPPNGIKIAENFFYDQTEIRNLDYLEYLHWTERVFGKKSEEIKAALPDTNVWKEKYACLLSNINYYLRHPDYKDYPTVGISQQQAINFSKWRSNRVFEYVLIRDGVIEWNLRQNADSNFTVERYFSGKYLNYKPDTNYKYYPNFRLPTVQEFKKALHYADSIDKVVCENFQSDIVPCIKDSFFNPTVNVNASCSKKKKTIYNLRGNVSEWTTENNICVGGGWTDTRQAILSKDTFQLKTANSSTGFRNVCEWKRWAK